MPLPKPRSALITGASSGLGRALALKIAASDISVTLVARRLDALQTLVQEIQAKGGKAWAFQADVSVLSEAKAAVGFAVDQMASIDLLICNAGISAPIAVRKMPAETIEDVMRINFLGTTNFIASVLPHMIREHRGHLVAVSSQAAFGAFPQNGPYCASKAALNIFMKSIQAEAAGLGIATTTICPGFVQTAMTAKNKFPMPFLMPEEQAVTLMWQAIQARKRMFAFPWQMRLLGRLLAALPQWFLWRMLQRSGAR